jgi:hypothetical protein
MNEMFERVVKAIGEASTSMKPHRTDRDLLEACVRAVHETMREPTEAMIKAASEHKGQMSYADVWRVMLDAALTNG